MTNPKLSTLVERLRRTEKRKSYVATNRTAPIIESEYDAPVNPDGPEAADTIEAAARKYAEAAKALKLCIPIIEEEREICFYGHKEVDGKVRDRNALYELRKYDKALKAARKALGSVRE